MARFAWSFAAALALGAMAAHAQPFPDPGQTVHLTVNGFPVTPQSPLPVTSTAASGSAGSTTSTPSYAKPAQSTYSRPAITSGAANSAANVFTAGTVVTGCELINTSAAVIYVVIGSVAVSTDQPVQPGQSYRCQSPTAQALSVYGASAWSIAGMVF